MNKKQKIFFSSLLAIVLIGFLSYYYIIHGGARNLAKEETNFTVSSAEIMSEFNSNIEISNKKYLEKAVVIKGTITSSNGSEVILDKTVICNFKSPDPSIKNGQTVSVKGRIVGYDDLMGELKLDQCFIIKN